MKLKVLDLFSGIGGFSLGLERTGGFETVAFCEINPFCQKVLKKHWPHVPIYDDVRTLEHAGAVDVITAGFPCQDISSMGLAAGINGQRSGLFFEALRIIGALRPAYAILENVPALLYRGLGSVLGGLASIGYDAEWDCIPHSAIGAVDQRDRAWIIAYPAHQQGMDKPVRSGTPARRLYYDLSLASRHANERNAALQGTPLVCRVDDELSNRVDRHSAIGNTIDCFIPFIIGSAILNAEVQCS